MHTFINSRPMAQMVAFDLMADEARRAQVRRGRWDRRAALAEAAASRRPRPARPRGRAGGGRTLHLVH